MAGWVVEEHCHLPKRETLSSSSSNYSDFGKIVKWHHTFSSIGVSITPTGVGGSEFAVWVEILARLLIFGRVSDLGGGTEGCWKRIVQESSKVTSLTSSITWLISGDLETFFRRKSARANALATDVEPFALCFRLSAKMAFIWGKRSLFGSKLFAAFEPMT